MWRNYVEIVENERIKAWEKDVLDGKKQSSLENEESKEDDISGQGNVCYLKIPFIEESIVHRNVDTLQVVCNERSHDEGCAMNLQEQSRNGIVGQRGT